MHCRCCSRPLVHHKGTSNAASHGEDAIAPEPPALMTAGEHFRLKVIHCDTVDTPATLHRTRNACIRHMRMCNGRVCVAPRMRTLTCCT
jgi:hypothetical protein